jgi:putative membrane protein
MANPVLDAFLRSWSFPPTIVAGLAVATLLYGLGVGRVWRRAGLGAVVPVWRAVAYAAGLLAVALALLSPIATFSSLLFTMHMAQHMLLSMVAAPLILLGAPLVPVLWGLPLEGRRALGRAFAPPTALHRLFGRLTHPPLALGLHTLMLWGWHVPALYEAALRSELVHELQHALVFGTGLLFWWPVIQPIPGRRRLPHAAALIYVSLGALAQKPLGGLLGLAGKPLYGYYEAVPRVWGLSALDDQRIAGLSMLTVGFFILAAAFTAVFWVWAIQEERREGPARRLIAARPAGPDSLELFRQALELRDGAAEAAPTPDGLRAVTGR